MEIIQNSKDVLYLSIAFGVLILSVFATWLIFYLVLITKESYGMIKELRGRINKTIDAVASIKEKIEHSASYLFVIGEGMKKIVEMGMRYKFGDDKREARKKGKK